MLWKVYAVLMGLISIMNLATVLLLTGLSQVNSTSTLIATLSTVLEAVQALGLIGYAFHFRIAKPAFWKLVFFLGLIAFAYSLVKDLMAGNMYSILGVLVMAPMYLGLYAYGFESRQIWGKTR